MAAGSSLCRRGSFTCYHGEQGKRPPVDGDTLGDRWKKERTVREFYIEAVRRLPLDDIPGLLDCIHAGGLCFGLADPVTNIILNAIALLGEHPPPATVRKLTSSPEQWMLLVLRSLFGLRAFMAAYFRYLTETQTRRYLHLASYDLSLAIKLVRHERYRSPSPSSPPKPLLPDGSRIKAALGVAALKASHPAPDDMARLMTARYPAHLLSPVVASLQRRERRLTTGEVWAIRDLLLAHQWPPKSPAFNIEFLSRPDGGGDTCSRNDNAGDAAATTTTLLQVSSCLAGDDGLVVRVAVERRDMSQSHRHITDLTFDNSARMEAALSACLAMAETGKDPPAAGTPAAAAPAPAVDYDASPCEHVESLKMCLRDAIRGLYIRALAALPRRARLVRALLAAGHCYGPMDAVSNVILSTAWYAASAGRGEPEVEEEDAAADILDTLPMSRLEFRSLDGLVAFLRAAATAGRPPLSEHEAVEHLYFYDCDVSGHLADDVPDAFTAAAKAARHPEHAAFGTFLASLVTSPERLVRLRSLLPVAAGERISDAHWRRLAAFLVGDGPSEMCRPTTSMSSQEMFRMNSSPPSTSVRTELDDMLRKYCNKHPWEPRYRLDIICGVWESKGSCAPKLYHANFLASVDDDADASPRERTLFFAEFREPSSSPLVQTEPSSCCPVYDYSACVGRCSYCEDEANGIVHPPSGGHSGSYIDASMRLYSFAKRSVLRIGLEGLPESGMNLRR
ncbi:unnamed protein product [Urochloa humidicola]